MLSVGISYEAVVRLRLMLGKMSERRSRSYAESGSVGSSRGSTWQEQRHKRREDRNHGQGEERSDLGEGLYQTYRIMSGAFGHVQYDERDKELERLRRLVRDLKLEARGRHQRRDQDNRERRSGNGENHYEIGSNQSSSH